MTWEAAFVLGWLLKVTVLLTGAYGLSLILRRAAAVVRYRVWIGALAAVFFGPVVAHTVNVPVPVLPTSLSVAMPASAPARGTPAAVAQRPGGGSEAEPATAIAGMPMRQLAVGVWLLAALVLIARLLWSAGVVHWIIARGRQLTDRQWTNLLYETADRLGLDSVPALYVSERTSVPLACRLHRPAIVLPASADEWSEERRRVVLLHELAHVKRRDLAGHTLSRLACAIYWFHPLVWFAAHRLRAESERACDDLALQGGEKPSDYAQQLLSMVAELRSDPAPVTAMAMAANREFEGRIVSILDPGVARRPRNTVHGILPIATVVSLGLVLAVSQPAARAATFSVAQVPTRSAIAELPNDTAALRLLLQTDPSAEVRAAVAWSLHERRAAAPVLLAALRSDPDASVREMAVWALGQHGDTAALPVLNAHLLVERAAPVRATTAWAIGQLRGASGEALLRLLPDRNVHVVRMAVWAISQNSPRPAPGAVLAHLQHPDRGVRFYAALALGEIADPGAIPQLQAALTAEQDSITYLAIVRALFESGDRSRVLVDAAMRSTDPGVRSRGAQLLAGQEPRPWPWPHPLPDPRALE